MSWITIVWSMVASACLTIALMHLIIWSRRKQDWVHLVFALAATSAAAFSAFELLLMRAETVEQYVALQHWLYVPAFAIVLALMGFTRLYLGTGRPWLAYTVCGLRLVTLAINFLSPVSINYAAITGLHRLTLIGGEVISVADGVRNPWNWIDELSLLLFFAFVADASITLWRRGNPRERRRALVVGGSITLCVLLGAGQVTLLHAGIIHTPYLVSIVFLGILAVMGNELSLDVARVNDLVRELQASEADLRESEQRMALAASAAELVLWMWNIADDDIWITDQGHAMFGLGKGEHINFERFLATLHPEDREPTRRAVMQSLHETSHYHAEYRVVHPDGNTRWYSAHGRVERDHQGQPVRMRGIAIDVTQRRQAELEAAHQRHELAHLSRVTMLGELSGSLAHELNQPLTAILSNAQAAQRFLARGTDNPDEMRDILTDIVSDDKRAGEVIRRLRGLLKKDEAQFLPIDLNEVVQEVLKLVRSDLLNRNVSIRMELAADLPVVSADRVLLQQVLLNLMMNGCDAMNGCDTRHRELVVRTAADGDEVRISVTDRGTGIPPGKLETIFESFYTTKDHGMGLGLSVCRSIVTSHRGRLWAENNPEGGASLHVALPLDAEGDRRE